MIMMMMNYGTFLGTLSLLIILSMIWHIKVIIIVPSKIKTVPLENRQLYINLYHFLLQLLTICYLINFQPLFKVSAQEKSLHPLSDEDIDKIKKAVQKRDDGLSETEVLSNNKFHFLSVCWKRITDNVKRTGEEIEKLSLSYLILALASFVICNLDACDKRVILFIQ